MKQRINIWPLVFSLLLSPFTLKAQTFSEWFSQKKTQKKYLIEQIAALQIYITYTKKGYDIAQKGLTVIGNIKNGDFNLHRDFFGSLKTVNPAIKHYSRVADLIVLQGKILKTYQKDFAYIERSSGMSGQRINYISQVYGRLLEDCSQLVDELIHIATDGSIELSDDQRLQRIDALYVQMQERYAFTKGFGTETIRLAEYRKTSRSAISKLKILDGLPLKD